MKLQWIAVAAASLSLTACATTGVQRDLDRTREESNPAGVKGLLEGEELRRIDVASLVSSFVPDATPRPPAGDPLDGAIARFYAAKFSNETVRANYRNEIQDRIFAASNQRCHLWKNYFASASSRVGFWSGFIGAATGAAALAFSPTDTKQALTAFSTTSTAAGTQYEKSYLYNLTMSVIFQGVEGRRSEILKSVREKRSEEKATVPLERYSLSAAIADGLEYHAACSLASGLQQASEKLADSRGAQTEPSGETPPDAGKADAGKAEPGKPDASKPGGKPGANKPATPAKPVPAAEALAPRRGPSSNYTTSSPASVPLF